MSAWYWLLFVLACFVCFVAVPWAWRRERQGRFIREQQEWNRMHRRDMRP